MARFTVWTWYDPLYDGDCYAVSFGEPPFAVLPDGSRRALEARPLFMIEADSLAEAEVEFYRRAHPEETPDATTHAEDAR